MFRSVNFPLEIDILEKDSVGENLRELSRFVMPVQKVLLVTTEHLFELYLDGEVEDNGVDIEVATIDAATTDTVAKLYKEYLNYSKQYGLIAGFGGGKVIDVAKYLAYMGILPVVSIPTTLSNDGISSPVSVLIDRGKGRRFSTKSQMPTKIILDLNIVSKAPKETTIAGIGDLLSNISALKDWKLANREIGEPIDTSAYILSHNASMNFYRRLLDESKVNLRDKQLLEELAYGLILSGISMAITGSSRPASGAEHAISHAIDFLYPNKSTYHGYQVAYGMLIAEQLRGNEISELISVFKKVGLPTSYRDLGLKKEEIIKAIQFAPKIRNRYTILNKVDLSTEKLEEIVI